MKTEEKRCFQYGREAAAANMQNAPCYDDRMRHMVSESSSESGCRRSIANTAAWNMGYLCQELLDGKPLDRERFLHGLRVLLPDTKEKAAEGWENFARECVESNQYVNFTAEPDETALCRWHDTILAGFVLLTERFGRDTATKVCDLSLEPCCLYPWEMERAAEEMEKGVSVDVLSQLMKDGELERNAPQFPTLWEVLHINEPVQDLRLDMTFGQ